MCELHRRIKIMPMNVSSTEAKSRLGAMLKWTKENQDEVIIRVHGEPEGVLISYEEYQKFEELRMRERKREVLEILRQLREEVRANTSELSKEEAYRLAGISESIAKKIIENDKENPAQGR
jgi:prevent-host-death family protein